MKYRNFLFGTRRGAFALLALALLTPRPGHAQEQAPESLSAAPPVPWLQGADLGQLPSVEEEPTPTPAADGKKDEKKPFWATHPAVTPLPRTGNFIIAPTGPGYYSFLDLLRGNYRENPPKFPWPPVSPFIGSFFDADFRYLDDPKNTQHDWLDPLKRIHAGCWLFSVGGEERFQYKNEVDSRLIPRNNVYELNRTRLYGDLWYSDVFRVYVEYINAQTFNQDLPPLAIDVNKSDLLNLFSEVKLLDIKDKGWYVRFGRQELLYGSQRLISPLDWANTRRTFEGVKTYWHGEKFDIDAFWTKPVVIGASRFDAIDADRQFMGVWTTYRPQKGQAIDAYYLFLDQSRPVSAIVPPTGRGGQNVNTLGSRYSGDKNHFLWDVEGMIQFGTVTNNTISAGAATTGLGYHFADLPMNPIFWVYNDYASGDESGGQGGTFNQLFPFGHFYLGFLDVPGRQNIDDINLHFSLNPTQWITTLVQGHFYYLASPRDALYGTGGQVIRKVPSGAAGSHVGNEIDWIVNFHLTTHQDLLLGYSKLYAGEYIQKSGPNVSPDLFYIQYSYKW